jgi:hypothetical protein
VYWYESYRAGGRVTSRYVASGAVAVACAWLAEHDRRKEARWRARHRRRLAALDARLRDQRRRVRRAWRDDRAAAAAADALLAGWCGWVEGVFRAAMAAAGCHRHNRSWRTKRMNSQERAEAVKRLREFEDRIAAGDPGLRAHAERLLDVTGDEGIAAWGGDLAARVVAGLTDRLAGAHLYRREAVARKLARVRADLEGPDPTPAERRLAERAAVCWLAAYEADLACQRAEGSGDARIAGWYDRRQDRAHRRFLLAVKALATLRRLALPARRPVIDFGGRLAGAGAAGRN